MRRRTYLQLLSTALVATAGCLRRTSTLTRGSTTTPNPDTVPADPACPSFDDRADRSVCSRSADGSAVALTPSTERLVVDPDDRAVEAITFTLTNRSSRRFGFNPYGWHIYRHADDGWTRVAPDGGPEPWRELTPGGTFQWSLSRTPHPSPHGEGASSIAVDLPSGSYAFAVAGLLGRNDGVRVECVAPFVVEIRTRQ